MTNALIDTELLTAVAFKAAQLGQPGVINIPFDTLPLNRYIRGPRYRVEFERSATPDMKELVTS